MHPRTLRTPLEVEPGVPAALPTPAPGESPGRSTVGEDLLPLDLDRDGVRTIGCTDDEGDPSPDAGSPDVETRDAWGERPGEQ